jgi:predicted peptidase
MTREGRKAGAENSYLEDSIIYTGGEYRDHAFKYRLLLPVDHDPAARPGGKSWPLILFLHGAGERGSDNAAQLKYLPELMALPEHREKHRAFVLAPQCPANRTWSAVDMKTMAASRSAGPTDEARAVLAMLDGVMRNHPVDPRRVYLTGLSMGGYGAWDLAARRPDLWAAVVPICGGGDPGTAARMKDLPIWAFQGAKDPVVPPERSREMVEAVRRAGGNPRTTEYADGAHDSWTPAYRDPDLLAWLFAQRKPGGA